MSTGSLRPVEDTPLARFEALMEQARAVGSDLDPEHIPAALGDLERTRAELWTRLSGRAVTERLLTAEQAAERLGFFHEDGTPDPAPLYRKRWPFTVPMSPGRTRYSEQGIERFIRSRLGR